MTIDDSGGFWAGGAPVVLYVTEANTVQIPDGTFLFDADFQRAGPDLILANPGLADILIVDYFRSADPADLIAPEGGKIAGHLVERLAGPLAPANMRRPMAMPRWAATRSDRSKRLRVAPGCSAPMAAPKS